MRRLVINFGMLTHDLAGERSSPRSRRATAGGSGELRSPANYVLSGAIMLSTLTGCHSNRTQPTTRPTTQQHVTERALPQRAQPTLIKQGKSPLVYMTEASATLRFADMTTGTELARALVKPGKIVRIDAARGVVMNDTVLRPGPLPEDHVFGIWLEPDPVSMDRNTVIQPAPDSKKSALSK